MDQNSNSRKYSKEEFNRYYTHILHFVYLVMNDKNLAVSLTKDVFTSSWAEVKTLRSQDMRIAALMKEAKERIMEYRRSVAAAAPAAPDAPDTACAEEVEPDEAAE